MVKRILTRSYFLLPFILMVSIILFFSYTDVFAEEIRGVTKDIIKIGIIADMTGPASAGARPVIEGNKTYIWYINDRGGIHGRKIKLIAEDSRYSIPHSMAAFKKLTFRDCVLAILGPHLTGECVALTSQITKEKIPVIPASSSDLLFKPLKRYMFIFGCKTSSYVNVLFDYMFKNLKAESPNLAVVYADLEFSKVIMKWVKERARFEGLKLHEEVLNLGAMDAVSQALNLKRAKPDYVIVAELVGTTAALLRDARKFGLRTQFMGVYTAVEDDIVKIAREAAEGYIGVHSFASWNDDTPGMAELRKVTLKYHPGTELPYRSKTYTIGWVDSVIMTEGLRRAGKNLNAETLVEALETLKNFDTGGCSPPITWSNTSHAPGDYCKIYRPM
ncbi:MAG: ABC transporter substrate-binding protein [Pseudomonadota bacterium]